MITITPELVGRRIVAYGQVTTIEEVREVPAGYMAVIVPPVVTPYKTYTKNWVVSQEIQSIEEHEEDHPLPQDTYDRGESQEC